MKDRPITTLFLLVSANGKIITERPDSFNFPNIDGVNERKDTPEKINMALVVIDNKLRLNENGIVYLTKWAKQFILITNNKNHPAFSMNIENLSIIYQEEIELNSLFKILKNEYHVESITIQSSDILNEALLQDKLFDYVNVVVSPMFIGCRSMQSLSSENSIRESSQLLPLSNLKLEEYKVLENSYIQLKYKVVN